MSINDKLDEEITQARIAAAVELEVERLRGQLEWYEDHFARLRRIEEAARVFVDNQPGTRLAPEFEAAWIDLRAVLEEEA